MMESLQNNTNDDLIDPITFTVMKDPVIVSSGHVFDRSTVYSAENKMNFNKCPITRQSLKSEVYPVVYLKRQINEMLIGKFDYAMQLAEMYFD